MGLSKDKQQEQGYNEQQRGDMVISQDWNLQILCFMACAAPMFELHSAGGQLGTRIASLGSRKRRKGPLRRRMGASARCLGP